MNFSFDEEIDLKRPDSHKWADADALFHGEDLLPLWVADMDFKAPPPVIEALRRRAEVGLFTYTALPRSLYEAVVDWLDHRHDWRVEREWLLYAPGVVALLSAAVRAFTEPGDSVIVQPPVYGPFSTVITDQGRNAVLNPLRMADGRYEMDLDHLELQLKDTKARLLFLCSPHNPVGRVWEAEEQRALAELCLAYDVLVVSDEIHADLVLEGRHRPFAALDPALAERTVTCIAPSKTFNLAGLQTAFAIVPNKRLRIALDQALGKREPNPFSVVAAEVAYREGEAWLNECLSYIRSNVQFALAYLAAHLPSAHAYVPEATYLLWVDLRGLGLPASRIQQLLVTEAKVAASQGKAFVSEGAGFIRLNLATRRVLLEEGLRRVAIALNGSASDRI